METINPISEYFEKNTANFLKFGGTSKTFAIRRGVWENAIDFDDAINFVNKKIGENISALKKTHGRVLDLGCGVGGTIFYLAERFVHFDFTGLTISPLQREIAQKNSRYFSKSGSLEFLERNFENLDGLGTFDVALAIESFVYASNLDHFFSTVSKSLKPGGQLIIVDDILSENPHRHRSAQTWLQDFKAGWRLNTLQNLSDIRVSARRAGLTLTAATDLTSSIKLGRPRDRLIAFLTPFFKFIGFSQPFFGNMVGGDALQKCLKHGVLQYQFLVFNKD